MNNSLWKNEYWERKQEEVCKKCKDERKKFGFSEVEDSPIYPGFYNNLDEKIDIFFVLESLGKREKWPETPEDAIDEARDYYLNTGLLTFHQKSIRELLKPLSSSSYILSDVVKCFVKKSRKKGENFNKAIEYCSQFLKEQINHYQPRIIVPIGHVARTTVSGFIDEKYRKKINNLGHGEWTEAYLKNDEKSRTFIVYCRFPSAWTADYWIRDGEHKPVVERLNKLLIRGKKR